MSAPSFHAENTMFVANNPSALGMASSSTRGSPGSVASDMAVKHGRVSSRGKGESKKRRKTNQHQRQYPPLPQQVEIRVNETKKKKVTFAEPLPRKPEAMEESSLFVVTNKKMHEAEELDNNGQKNLNGGISLGQGLGKVDVVGENEPTENMGGILAQSQHAEKTEKAKKMLEFADKIRKNFSANNKKSNERMENFMDGVEMRSNATAKLENVLQTFKTDLSGEFGAFMENVIEFVHREIDAELHNMEQAILHLFVKNQQHRRRLFLRIERAQKAYNSRKEMLLARVTHGTTDNAEDTTMSPGGNLDNSTQDNGGMVGDPDWNALVEAYPQKQDIYLSFLDARKKKEKAVTALGTLWNSLETEFTKNVEDAVVELAQMLHHDVCSTMDAKEDSIFETHVSSYHKREALKEGLEKTQKEAEAFFLSALNRIMGG